MRTCKIIFGKNFVPQRKGRPSCNCYRPSRKRLLALGLSVGRKASRRVRVTA